MSDKDLTASDVFTFVFEEYFKDGVLDSDEKDKINLFRQVLGISNSQYIKIMNSVNERFQKGDIAFEDTPHEQNNLIIYKKILDKAFKDNIITKSEESIILKTADILMIDKESHDKIVNELKNNLRKQARKFVIESLDPNYKILDVTVKNIEIPEISIEFDCDSIDDYFIRNFEKNYEEFDIFFVNDSIDEESKIVFMDTSLKSKLFQIYFSDKDEKYFFNFFPLNSKYYSIEFKSHKNSHKIIRFGSVDSTGSYYNGISEFLRGQFNDAIDSFKTVIQERDHIFNVYNLMGLCYKLKGDFQSAIYYYQEELIRFPFNNRAISNIGIVYKQMSEPKKALSFFEQSLSVDPLDPNCIISAIATYAYFPKQNLNKILDFLFICNKIWKDFPAYSKILEALVSNLKIENIENMAIEKNKEFNLIILEFLKLRNLFISGFYSQALNKTYEFLNKFRGLYITNAFFKGAFEVFFINRISFFPKQIKKQNQELIERITSKIYG